MNISKAISPYPNYQRAKFKPLCKTQPSSLFSGEQPVEKSHQPTTFFSKVKKMVKYTAIGLVALVAFKKFRGLLQKSFVQS